VLGVTHLELSAEALAVWNLPEQIQRAVRFTLTPDLDPTVANADGMTLSRILNVADRYVSGTGTSLHLFENTAEDGQAALESLGLGDDTAAVLSEFEAEFSTIRAYF